MMRTDTIAAIATAVQNGGISIIRISGEEAVSLADRIFHSKKEKKLSDVKSHTIHYGHIKEEGKIIDEVMVSVMRAPNTYTREDVVEINCHGGPRVTKRILDLVIRTGARPAEPGEFTKRAFLNGRIDLSQAEAVMDIIQSQNDYALESSVSQLGGNIRASLKDVRETILNDLAFIEAALDDPEHIQVEEKTDEIREHIDTNKEKLRHLLKNSENGRLIREGIRTVILGKPNAGKSSFLNRVAGEELAIVTDVAGTTRDFLEQTILLGGIQLTVTDTAGIRNTDDAVEKIGVERARKKAEEADLILYMMDASVPLDENDEEIIELIKDRQALVLLNKSDLTPVLNREEIGKRTGKEVFEISAREGHGFDRLEERLGEMFFQGKLNFNDEIYITNVRQKDALRRAYESICRVEESMDAGMPEDFLTIDLMSAYECLGEITGETTAEDLADRIFRDFCVGK